MTAADAEAGDNFGTSVSGSGDTALVGAPGAGDKGPFSGAAYVFVRDGAGVWSQQAKLTASDGAAFDGFGASVSFSGDTALVGSFQDDDNGIDSGSAYLFVRDGAGIWGQQDKLTASDGAESDGFGSSVSISGDSALVGAFQNDGAATSSGSAYVFARDGAGSWSQETKLAASDGASSDLFGEP